GAAATRAAAVAGLALFWLGTAVAGAAAPGYSARADYVSSLAGRGSEVAATGLAALVALALAHVAAGVVVSGALSAAAGAALVVAGGCGLVVAAFRTGCPLGAAGCGTAPNDAPADLADTLHVAGVVGYEIALVVAMVLVARGLGRGLPAVATVVAAVASTVLAVRIGGPDLGLDQRLWLAVNTAWVAAAAVLLRGR
ncbi:MAG: DUF998 domain-containing protein, partial [Pseudonocardiales bacterium]|nr:DUF998 domain-containing protein [Pseudonocardiales bacterium]